MLNSAQSTLSRPKAVSKGVMNAPNLGKPAPFDTRSALLRATQDAFKELSIIGIKYLRE
jgi:hypothetical protein